MHLFFRASAVVFTAFLVLAFTGVCNAAEYELGPDSWWENVPHGTLTKYQIISTKAYPGVPHDYSVYVPAQYDGKTPAAVMVFQDGGVFQEVAGEVRVPAVFDNLIFKKDMPITIAVMVNPGMLPAVDPKTQLPRSQRSFEYDSPTGLYASFILDEVLPEVGKKYKLTDDPNLRATCGFSSGGICAFTMAWERPDAFRRVMSFVGSFGDLRGGNRYPDLIRKTEPKPIRVFLQSGAKDMDIFAGSWLAANQDMGSALKWAGYDYQLVVGDEGHNLKQGSAIFPDALRWLWKDYDKPIVASSKSPGNSIMDVLVPGEEWQIVSEGHKKLSGIAADSEGNVYVSDAQDDKIFKVGLDGKTLAWVENVGASGALAVGADGKLYVALPGKNQIVAYDLKDPKAQPIADGVEGCDDLAVDHAGHIYVSAAAKKQVWLIAPGGEKKLVDEGIEFPAGIGFTPDQGQLAVVDGTGVNVYLFDIQADGTLSHKQPYYTADVPAMESRAGSGGRCTDNNGRLYLCTTLGIQIFDQHGRLWGIISTPRGTSFGHVTLGGKDFDTLFAISGDAIYRRKTKTKGVHGFQTPAKATPDRLG